MAKPSGTRPTMAGTGSVLVDKQAVDLLTSWVQSNPEEWKAMIARCAGEGS